MDNPLTEPKPVIPLTQKVKRRKPKQPVKKDDIIKVGTIWIEKRDITFEF